MDDDTGKLITVCKSHLNQKDVNEYRSMSNHVHANNKHKINKKYSLRSILCMSPIIVGAYQVSRCG